MENGKIYGKICDTMADIEAIGKVNINQKQNYKYRGIDDVYNDLHNILAKNRIFTTSKICGDFKTESYTNRNGTQIFKITAIIEYTFFTDDGSSVTTSILAVGMDSGDKEANKAMSVAHKYALMQIFCIPTNDKKDPETDSHEIISQHKVPKKKITEKQLKLLEYEIGNRTVDREKFKEYCKVEHLKDITMDEFNGVLETVRQKPLIDKGEDIVDVPQNYGVYQ